MAIPMVDGWPYPSVEIDVGSCVSGKSEVTTLINGGAPSSFSWISTEQFNGSLLDLRDIKDALEILVARTLPPEVEWARENVSFGSDNQRKIAAISYRVADPSKEVYYNSAMKWK